MHLRKLLHKTFLKTSSKLDKRNHKTIIEAAITLSDCRHLSIAGIGRSLLSKAKVKHCIKRIDRLFGNHQVQSVTTFYYQEMAFILLHGIQQPVISIDWSGLTPCGEFHLLRASCPVGGRAITLFEQSFTEREYMKQNVHKRFLAKLKDILPKNCRPIIVTDAGFRCPWFKLIRSFGWHFVGRVRNSTQYLSPRLEKWIAIKKLYVRATQKPEYLFETQIAKANPVEGHLFLYKSKAKRRKNKNLRGKKIQCSSSLKHARRGREPWLLFTSLHRNDFNAKVIVKLYAQRMQIEESFRDLKNTNNGLSMRHCRSYQKGRLNVALLIAAITAFLLWLVGLVAKGQQIHLSFQANTISTRNVLSSFTIGWQYLKRRGMQISIADFNLAKKQLRIDCLQCL